ncbi:RNA polymerase II transcription factor B subunit 1 [Elasticomyces elasticus]|nr:RNA polymerase II transcription factor B subunit 1 [Elasticomyces elasticus]
MASPRASASYKKKDGTLAVAADRQFLFWTPAAPSGASPSVTLSVRDITNLQQTPAANPKVALKIFVQPIGTLSPEGHVFSFISATAARAEQEAITEVLRNELAALKNAGANTTAASVAISGDKPAAMAIAQAVSSGTRIGVDAWYSDTKLKADLALQKSLLDADPTLRQRFSEALRDRPDTISTPQFSAQFWSNRLHLLRAHAIERDQAQGDYNVLPEIKFTRIPAEKEGESDRLVLNLAKEQISLIFKQYPVVRQAYNDNVPNVVDTSMYWTRFFNSRLLKKLKGITITKDDPTDAIFDRYLDYQESGPAATGQVPNFIDLEGNEQDHSQRKGNRPDQTMRPGSVEKVPILRVLNSLSEKLIAQVAPADGEAHAPIGMDEETYYELQLRDLQADNPENRVSLNIRDQQRFLSGNPNDQISSDAALYAKQPPLKVLADLKSRLAPESLGISKAGNLELDCVLGYQSESESSDDEAPANGVRVKRLPRVGSKAALTSANTHILSSITSRNSSFSDTTDPLLGLSQSTFDTLTMTHNTTIEFLHYFYTVFLSGSTSQSSTTELRNLFSTLEKSLDRLDSVADVAETERKKELERRRREPKEYEKRTGKRRRVEEMGGGKEVVESVVAPTVRALQVATDRYRKAFEKQSAAA